MLYEELSQSFPTEVIEPYGEVLIIPSKAFQSEWQKQLEAEGVKILAQNYGHQSVFFLRKSNQTGKPQKLVYGPWGESEIAELQKLRSQGLSYRQIAEKIGRSVHAIYRKAKKLENLELETNVDVSGVKELKLEPDVIKEFLEACSLLYPKHRHACAFLLREASDKILKQV